MTLPIFMCHTQVRHAAAIETRTVYACLGQSAKQKFQFVVLSCSHYIFGRKREKECYQPTAKGKNYDDSGFK